MSRRISQVLCRDVLPTLLMLLCLGWLTLLALDALMEVSPENQPLVAGQQRP